MIHPSKRPLKRVCRQVIEPNRSARPFVAMEHVEAVTGRITSEQAFANVQGDQYLNFGPGDTLFGKLRPYLRKVALADREGCCVSEFLVLRPEHGYDARFVCWALRTGPVTEHAMLTAEGAKMPRTSWEKLGGFGIVDWSPWEQQRIADYLDRETARIDALIERHERLAALVIERTDAQVESILLGANLPDQIATGDAFVPSMPRSWRLMRLKQIAVRVDVGIATAATHAYVTEGVPIVRSTNVRTNGLDGALLHLDPGFAADFKSKRLHADDILTVRTGNVGVSAQVPPQLEGAQCFTLLITTVRPPQDATFVCRFLNSRASRRYFATVGWGTAQANISVPLLGRAPVAVPPAHLQPVIVRQVDELMRRGAEVVALLNRHVALLRERRAAIITAAVSGDLDLASEAA